MEHVINIEKLTKSFVLKRSYKGISGALKGLFRPQTRRVIGINDLTFSVRKGERLAFIGPNGAGKSTTIKLLTGILYPTSGKIEVLGLTPWKDRKALGFRIGTVFGQRTQLWHHLPPSDTFDLLSKIYEIEEKVYEKRLQKLVEIFEITPFFEKPVRQLSLGQRMRCELVASLLHKPEILFLDEPTIGLDINAKLKIRSLLNELSQEEGTTLFLTSHDTADIEQVCDRVVILNEGQIVLDNPLKELKRTAIKKKILTIVTGEEKVDLALDGLDVLENRDYHFVCEINLEKITIEQVIHEILKKTTLKDLTVEDPSMEEIIQNLYG